MKEAFASCKFPLLNQWKKLTEKSELLTIIDSTLTGYGQIVLTDNSFTGLLFVIVCFMNSIPFGFATLFTTLFAALFARYILGVPTAVLQTGFYTFSPALAGMAMGTFIFPGQPITLSMVVLSIVIAILCVIVWGGFSGVLIKVDASALSMPFCLVVAFIIPGALHFTNMPVTFILSPYLNELADATTSGAGTWTISEFFTASINNFSEILFQATPLAGILILIGIAFSSRIDVVSAVIAACSATLVSILLGLPKDLIMLGLYGYNAIFTFILVYGRAFRVSIKSLIFALLSGCCSVILYQGLAALFAPFGIPVLTWPFCIIGLLILLARYSFSGLQSVQLIHWGVPETIEKMFKEKEKESEGTCEADVAI